MKNFAQLGRDGAVVGVRRHDLLHVRPPFLADRRSSDGVPACFILDLGERKKLVRFRLEKDGIISHAMFAQSRFQLRPNRGMTPLLFRFGTSVDRHDERFANHA